MKKLFAILCAFYFLPGSINGQTELPKPTIEEECEAKNLAVSFFNDFQKTQNLAPLIKKYFIKDFVKRLKFCGTTGECGGTDRDFWQEEEELVAINAAEMDFRRQYILVVTEWYLSLRSMQYFNYSEPLKMNIDDEKKAEKIIQRKIKHVLKDRLDLIKFGSDFFSGSDEESGVKFKTLNEFRRFMNNLEKYLAALKLVESELRNEFQKANPRTGISYLPLNFRVDVEVNYNRFFDYPVGTQMLEVWSENGSTPFIMDLIKEGGKLKIVAVYPPID